MVDLKAGENVMRVLLCGALLALVSMGAVASDADVIAAIRACANEKSDEKRLACYDEAVGIRQAPVAAGSAVATVAPAQGSTPATPEQGFGYRGEVAREELDRQEAAKSPAIEELTAQITAVSFQPYGQFVVTLDNDQVWTQKQTDTKVKPRIGESVTIKAGTFGSFILVTQSGRSTRVSRVR